MKIEKCKAADFFTAVSPEEIDEAMCRGDIGPNCMGAPTPVVGQIASPTRR
jgi:hypothetical protein